MRLKKLLLLAALITAALSPSPSLAARIDLQHTEIGDKGFLDASTLQSYTVGYIPPDSMITFTYNTVGAFGNAQLSAAGHLELLSDGTTSSHSYYSTWWESGGYNLHVKGAPNSVTEFLDTSEMPVQAFVKVAERKTVIKNFAAQAADFHSIYYWPTGSATLSSVYYEVSAVPLPAALPLFGLALVGMAGYNRKKKKEA